MINFVGQEIGNYRIVRQLGKGGFAEVYLGEHQYLNTQAAIKVLYASLTRNDRESFVHEAQIVARLRHPHIIQVFDFGLTGPQRDTPYLVMEHAPAGQLRYYHPRGARVPLARINAYVKQIASALHYAHEQQIIHCDVKPENMLIGQDQRILLSDFGIAVVSQSQKIPTESKEVSGTVYYMGPEQLRGTPTFASDQYALAVIVYEWLVGTPPFQGRPFEIMSQHMLQTVPSLRSSIPDISSELEDIIMIALRKDPTERFKSIQAFAHALDQATRSMGIEPDPVPSTAELIPGSFYRTVGSFTMPPVTPQPELNTIPLPDLPPITETPRISRKIGRRTLLLGLAGLSGLAALGGGGYALFQILMPPRPALHYTISGPTAHTQPVTSVAWSPNGEFLATGSQDNSALVWNAATGDRAREYRDHPYAMNAVAWSPNGEFLATGSRDGVLRIIPFPNGGRKLLRKEDSSPIVAIAWSPDGKHLAAAHEDGVALVYEVAQDRVVKRFVHAASLTSLAWSPVQGDARIVSGDSNGAVLLWQLDTDTVICPQTNHIAGITALTWSPDGKHMAVAGTLREELTSVQVCAATPETGKYPIYTHHQKSTILAVAWSPDGQTIASGGQDRTIHIWNASSAIQQHTCVGHQGSVTELAWSPDSARLASVSSDKSIRVWQVR